MQASYITNCSMLKTECSVFQCRL